MCVQAYEENRPRRSLPRRMSHFQRAQLLKHSTALTHQEIQAATDAATKTHKQRMRTAEKERNRGKGKQSYRDKLEEIVESATRKVSKRLGSRRSSTGSLPTIMDNFEQEAEEQETNLNQAWSNNLSLSFQSSTPSLTASKSLGNMARWTNYNKNHPLTDTAVEISC